jgi:hypothetical protein
MCKIFDRGIIVKHMPVYKGNEMSNKGYVYILTNPSMPGLVKIGKTTRDVFQRSVELYQTGVPKPFTVYHSVFSPDCHTLEVNIHRQLNECRPTQDREFFNIQPIDAMNRLEDCLYEQIYGWMDEFLPGYRIVWEPNYVCEAHMSFLANEMDVATYEIAQAMDELTGDDMKPALKRYMDRMEKRKNIKELKVVGE